MSSPFRLWAMAFLGGMFATGLLGDSGIGEALFTVLWLMLLLAVWVMLAFYFVSGAHGHRLKAAGLSLCGLCVTLALTIPMGRLGAVAKVYVILAANHSTYEAQAAAEARKPGREMFIAPYGGWLSDDLEIVRDARGNPQDRLKAISGAQYADCRWLAGNYYDCGVSY